MSKQLTEVEILAQLEVISKKKQSIAAKITPLQKQFARVASKAEKLRDQLNKMKKTDLAYVMFEVSAHNEWQASMPKQAYGSGYWPEVGEQAWKLMLKYQAEPQQDLIDFIAKWLPLSKCKMIEVFRYDCCEDGSWIVEYREGKWVVYDQSDWSYQREGKVEAEFDDVVEMCKYVAEHHWFDGGVRPDRDEF